MKLDIFIQKALNEMFRVVGFDKFDEEFVKQPDWYSKKTWNSETERAFRDWFIKAAKKDLKLTEAAAEKEFSWFNFKWGWKLEE
jgi:hypothetical protein